MSVGYSSARPAGREHIPLYPKGFIAIRIVQLVLAVIILALAAWSLSMLGLVGPVLSIFTAIITIGIAIYSIVVDFSRDSWKHYNYWAIMALDILLIIFWLPSFALVATAVSGGVICDYWDCYYMSDSFFACLAVVAALGGAEFALFVISLAIHSVAVHRHRSAGLRCKGNGLSTDFEGGDRHHTAAEYDPNSIPMDVGAGAPPQTAVGEKQQPVPTYSSATPPHHQHQVPQQLPPQQQQQQFQPQPVAAPQQQQYATVSPTPPSGGMYQPPASPQPFYPPQQQQVSPLGGPGQFGAAPVPAPHPGSYEAHGQPVGYHQQH